MHRQEPYQVTREYYEDYRMALSASARSMIARKHSFADSNFVEGVKRTFTIHDEVKFSTVINRITSGLCTQDWLRSQDRVTTLAETSYVSVNESITFVDKQGVGSALVVADTTGRGPKYWTLRIKVFGTKKGLAPIILTSISSDMLEGLIADSSVTVDLSVVFTAGEAQSKVRLYELSEQVETIIHQEAYPSIPDVHQMVEDFLCSRSPVLLLKGPPGTGKTQLIRYIMKRGKALAEKQGTTKEGKYIYLTAPHLLATGEVISEALDASTLGIVAEDIDEFLLPRNDGNSNMQLVLGLSDGVIQSPHRKIILSTNLPQDIKIDKALLRPGRCYGTYHMRLLNAREAEALARRLDIDPKCLPRKQSYGLGDVYSLLTDINRPQEERRHIGF